MHAQRRESLGMRLTECIHVHVLVYAVFLYIHVHDNSYLCTTYFIGFTEGFTTTPNTMGVINENGQKRGYQKVKGGGVGGGGGGGGKKCFHLLPKIHSSQPIVAHSSPVFTG